MGVAKAGAVRAALWGAVVLLAGCSGDSVFSGRSGGGSTFGNLLAFNTTSPGPAPAAASSQDAPLQCPIVEVLDGTASVRSYAGTDQANGSVRYQFSMGDVARECSHQGDQVALKIGVEGRVLLGPSGAPGSFTVPVRVAIRRDKDQKVEVSKLYQVPATVAAGESQTDFQLVTEPLTVPYLQAHADEDYTILVGFDQQTKPAAPASGKKGRKRAAAAN